MVMVGAGLQIIGFLVLAGQLARVRRQEFGWPDLMRRSWAWTSLRLRRPLRRPVHAQVHSVLPVMTTEAAGRLRAREGMVPKDGNVWRILRFEIPADQQPTR
jgi:hypothetical protein